MMRIPIIWGKRLYGKVDQGANQIHVATLFFHIWFCPIFPLQSYIVFENESKEDDFRGIVIGVNFKSIMAAYLRFIFGIAGLILTLLGMFTLFDKSGKMISESLIRLLLGICALAVVALTYELFRASPQRAQKLAAMVGIPSTPGFGSEKGARKFLTPQQNSTPNNRETNQDRFCTITLSPQEARAGTQVVLELSHLPDKRKIKLAIPAGLPPQSKLRLNGLGAPGGVDKPAGNLYVNIDIQET
jgi:hypothetical protein